MSRDHWGKGEGPLSHFPPVTRSLRLLRVLVPFVGMNARPLRTVFSASSASCDEIISIRLGAFCRLGDLHESPSVSSVVCEFVLGS